MAGDADAAAAAEAGDVSGAVNQSRPLLGRRNRTRRKTDCLPGAGSLCFCLHIFWTETSRSGAKLSFYSLVAAVSSVLGMYAWARYHVSSAGSNGGDILIPMGYFISLSGLALQSLSAEHRIGSDRFCMAKIIYSPWILQVCSSQCRQPPARRSVVLPDL